MKLYDSLVKKPSKEEIDRRKKELFGKRNKNKWFKEKITKKIFYEYPGDLDAFKEYINTLFNSIIGRVGVLNPNRDVTINEINQAIDLHIISTEQINYDELEVIRKKFETISKSGQKEYDKLYSEEKNRILEEYNNFLESLDKNKINTNKNLSKKIDEYRKLDVNTNFNFLNNEDRAEIDIIKSQIEQKLIIIEIAVNKNEKEKEQELTLSKLNTLYEEYKIAANQNKANKILSEVVIFEQQLDSSSLNGKNLKNYFDLKYKFEQSATVLLRKFETDKQKKYNKNVSNNIKKSYDLYLKEAKKYKKNANNIINLFKKYKFHEINQNNLYPEVATYFSTTYSKIFTELNDEVKYELTKWMASAKKDDVI
jgi:hypothetical protein